MTTPQEHSATMSRGSHLWLTLALGSFGVAIWMALLLYVVMSPTLKETLRFASVVNAVNAEYSGELESADIFENAANELYGMLDRYSGYAPPEVFHQVDEELSGYYAGIGVSVVAAERGLLVATVNEAGPARAAGMLLGDYITAADSVNIVGKSTFESTLILRGEAGDTVVVTALRPKPALGIAMRNGAKSDDNDLDYDTLIFPIERKAVPLKRIEFAGVTADTALYIKLNDFEGGAFEQFTSVFDSLKRIAPAYRGVIIDLRSNPGGLLSEAVKFADYFLDDGELILGRKGRSRWSRQEYYSEGKDQTGGKPVVILLNRGSASASEVFSGALKYAGRATLIGDTTFGKGLVQGYRMFPDGSASRLTVARYYFTGEVYLNNPAAEDVDSGSGIPPDIYFEFEHSSRFVSALNAKFLFHEFSARYQERILELLEAHDSLTLLHEFANWVEKTGFTYENRIVAEAKKLLSWTLIASDNEDAPEIAREIVARAETLEKDLFAANREPIVRAIARLTIERKFGHGPAFERVTFPGDPGILRARSALDSLVAQSAEL